MSLSGSSTRGRNNPGSHAERVQKNRLQLLFRDPDVRLGAYRSVIGKEVLDDGR